MNIATVLDNLKKIIIFAILIALVYYSNTGIAYIKSTVKRFTEPPKGPEITKKKNALGISNEHIHPTVAYTFPFEYEKCRLNQIAFCDTFSTSHPGGRGGELDEKFWSVARITKRTSAYHGNVNEYLPTKAQMCRNAITGIKPPGDSFFCGPEFGESLHWMTTFNDGADDRGYMATSARIRQPFDFAGRMGKLVVDVDAKNGPGGPWMNIWITEDPIPAPHESFQESSSIPKNGITLNFSTSCGKEPFTMVGLSKIYVYNNYTETETPFIGEGCVTTSDDAPNHIEVRINQNALEVWMSDASPDHGVTFPNLKRVANAQLNLNFSRGYVHLQHSSNNGNKQGSQSQVTYHWDNIGFDGPILPVNRGYEVPDALTPGESGSVNLGYALWEGARTPSPGGMYTCCDEKTGEPRFGGYKPFTKIPAFTLKNVDLTRIRQARLSFNANGFTKDITLRYRFNNNEWKNYTYPYGGTAGTWQAETIVIPLSDLRQGTNTLEFINAGEAPDANSPVVIANIDLELIP